jgi:benzoate-CoA ligase family protein
VSEADASAFGLADIPAEFNVASWVLDRQVAEGRGGNTALVLAERRLDFAELTELSDRAGGALREMGVRPGERVLLVLSDGAEFVASWYGALKAGAVTAEAYTFLPVKDLAYLLRYSQARVVVADPTTLANVREAVAGSPWSHTILAVGVPAADLLPGEVSWDAALEAPAAFEPPPTMRDDIAIWKFTTGSTGRPKAAVHTHASPRLSSEWYGQGVLGLGPDDLVLAVPKLFFGYARDLTTLFPQAAGGAGIAFPERSTPERIFDLVERHRPTVLVTVPTMIQQMLDLDGAESRDLSSLRLCTSAGEALPAALLDRWRERFGVEVLDGLGSSEAYHIYISQYPGESRPGTIGRLVPGYEARLVDEAGEDVADGETGELWLRGGTAALMYWADREKSLATYAGDVVHTGDLLSRDEAGFFTYRGRADSLLKVGGIWVAPDEVEACLGAHEAVAEAAVVGVDRRGLTVTRAYVVAAAGTVADEALAETLRKHVRETLSPHKYPREVVFLDQMPRTGSGKVDRAEIRRLAEGTGEAGASGRCAGEAGARDG